MLAAQIYFKLCVVGVTERQIMSNIRWLGPYKPGDRHADDITISELIRLRKENDKYKRVMEVIWNRGGLDAETTEIIKEIMADGMELQGR